MDQEYDSQSWQDRCERYFTSISDTGKDRDQEKHARNESENSRAKRGHGHDDNDKIWKDLSEVRRRFSEHRPVRKARKALRVLDIHGAKIGSKANGTTGFIIWITVILIAVIAFGVLLFFVMKDFLQDNSTYRIINMSSDSKRPDKISLTVCNLNTIKKSKLASSDMNDLKNTLLGTRVKVKMDNRKTVNEIINSNSELKNILVNRYPGTFSDFVAEIEKDVVVKEMTTPSDEHVFNRLSNYGRPELLKDLAPISMYVLEEMGHFTNETLVECWIANIQCQEKEVHTITDPVHGNCIQLSTRCDSEPIELILDAQSEEYIHQVAPSVGFKLSVDERAGDVHDQWIHVSPGFHSTISLHKLTEIKRLESTCDKSVVSKKECGNRCFKKHITTLCGCSLYGEEPDTELCKMDEVSDYVCVRSLRFLQKGGNLPCQCTEICSEKKFDLRKAVTEWPSTAYMARFGKSRFPNVTIDHIRANIAKLTIQLTPVMFEEIEEYQSYKVIDLLATIGGLSALVAGVSAVTILELAFMTVQGVVRFVRYIRKRSDDIASPKRLSDSEITSITWAMYRQRRRYEEMNKVKDKLANNTGVNALGGNAQSRIIRSNSYATADVNKEVNGDLMNKQMASNSNNPTRHHYSRRYDGKHPAYQSHNRDSLTQGSRKNNGDISNKYRDSGADYQVNVIRPQRPMDYMYDNRKVPVYTGNVPYLNGPTYLEVTGKERQQADNVLFYDGAAAYFNPSHITEPVYL